MAKQNTPAPKLFGALGPDDSYFDARTKAAAKDAQQRWPLFKAVAPQSGDATPTLSPDEKARWEQIDVVHQETPKLVLSRPGLSSKLAIGLGKIARQTSADAAGSTERIRPRTEAPIAFVPPPFPTPVHVQAAEAAPNIPTAKRTLRQEAVEATPTTISDVLFPKRNIRADAAPKPAPTTDDSLSSIFQRVEGDVKPPTPTVAARKGAMKRLGKR
jgi:hypothetical protein